MPEQHGEKTQEPTPHRRQKAREEGFVAKSQDLASAVLLLAGTGSLIMAGGVVFAYLRASLESSLRGATPLAADPSSAIALWHKTTFEWAWYVLPILGLMLFAAVAANLVQFGFLFLPEKVLPDFSRLDPLQGLRRIASLTNVARLGFGIFKVAVVTTVGAVVLYQEHATILGLTGLDAPEIAFYLARVLAWTTIKIGAALLVLALLDYGFQWWKHEQDLRMTPQEVREELRHLEGDPQIAARRKAVQRQLVLHRLSEAVPKADVVVTNPTELAVAIQYDPQTMPAPVVVAKGAGLLAQRIRRLALEHGIPVLERKSLAQALYREAEINRPIAADKYAAVAEVLAYVYHLKGKKLPAEKW